MTDRKLTQVQSKIIKEMREGATLHIICNHQTSYFIGWGNNTLRPVQHRTIYELERLDLIDAVQENPSSHGHFILTTLGQSIDIK